MTKGLLYWTSLLLLSLAPSLVAAEKEEVPQTFQKAATAYEAKDYELAAQLFLLAYEQSPDTSTLFALAQSERLAGNCERAMEHYEKLRRDNLPDEDKLRVFQGLELCGVFDRNDIAEKSNDEIDSNLPEALEVADLSKSATLGAGTDTDWFAVTLLAGGLVGIGVGTSFWLVSNSQQSDLGSAQTDAAHLRLEKRARNSRSVAVVAYVSGAVLLSGAALRFILNHDEPTSKSDISASGWVGNQSGGISVWGEF